MTDKSRNCMFRCLEKVKINSKKAAEFNESEKSGTQKELHINAIRILVKALDDMGSDETVEKVMDEVVDCIKHSPVEIKAEWIGNILNKLPESEVKKIYESVVI